MRRSVTLITVLTIQGSDLKKRSANPTDLYPLPDGVVGGRPAVLLVVETRAFGGPVGVVLGGGADLV